MLITTNRSAKGLGLTAEAFCSRMGMEVAMMDVAATKDLFDRLYKAVVIQRKEARFAKRKPYPVTVTRQEQEALSFMLARSAYPELDIYGNHTLWEVLTVKINSTVPIQVLNHDTHEVDQIF